MGQSRHHASNIAKILYIHKAYVSPQFHCTFDTQFQTIQDIQHIEGSWVISVGLKPDINNDEANNTTVHQPTTITSIRIQNMEHQKMENEQTDNVQTPVGWRSSRKKKTTERLMYAQSMEFQEGRDTDVVQEIFVEHNLDNKKPFTIMKTILDEQDTLYLHESRKQPDWDKF